MSIDFLNKKVAMVWLDSIFSDERERIHNPVIDEEKYHLL